MVKEANLFASQRGPIILAQIENEYGNIMWGYGDAGKSYIKWCAQMAVAQNIGVPWIMCQQYDAPQPMINTCNGYYCDNFQPNNPKSPKMFTENWIGWFQKWGERVPHRSAEDSAFSVARFFQNGGVLNNYYMYHGGTNFGRIAGGPYITTSYDYNAPLDEYGNLNQPKWGHLKQLHAAIKLGEKILTNGTRSDKYLGNAVTLTTYTGDGGARFCFLSNTNKNADASVNLKQDGKYFLLLANLGVGTERKKDTLRGKGNVDANQLLEQKELTLDASDYLWYMTSVDINDTSIWSNATLCVDTMGHTLHAYVNRRYAGYKFSHGEASSLPPWGFQITAQGFDKIKTGIAGGPVQLIGKNNVTMDLSTNLWSYKIGLNGERKRLYDLQPQISVSWHANSSYPISKPMTWYKADFEAPYGTNPVVVDLQGLGKGHAWVNGHSIGRYWPSWITASNGCKDTCDYRGKYAETLKTFPSKQSQQNPSETQRESVALLSRGSWEAIDSRSRDRSNA
ncbi:hypothetical protein Fmac_027061 [Flemingia macrophylla]|uniref:beta-galactosidase n=1 Tax=Flemingia macrophylla TaxID=520843 RepID=A0ABD1LGT1_9FABA